MANGKLRNYFWRIKTFLAEHSDAVDSESSAFRFPEEDDVVNFELIDALLVFRDGSKLYVRAGLDYEAVVQEHSYAYIYYDSHGNRIFQYDDSPHHPDRGVKSKKLSERIEAIDVPRVDFITIVAKVLERLKKEK